MDPDKLAKLIDLWKLRVWDDQENVDPNNDDDWRALAKGFALGAGVTVDEMWAFVQAVADTGLL